MKLGEAFGLFAGGVGVLLSVLAITKKAGATTPSSGIPSGNIQSVTQGNLTGGSADTGSSYFAEQVRHGVPQNWSAGTQTIDYITSQTGTQVTTQQQPDGTIKIVTTGTGGNTGSLKVSDTGKGGTGAVSGADVYVGSTGGHTSQETADYGYASVYRMAARQGAAFQRMSENERLKYVKLLGYDPLGKWVKNGGTWVQVNG